MDNFVANMWNFVKNPQILSHNEGYYIFRFETIGDRAEVLQKRPYTYHTKLFILKPWVVNFAFYAESITTIPWVTGRLLVTRSFSNVSSAMGKSLNTEKYTANMTRISYAWVLIEMDISQLMVDMIVIETPYGSIEKNSRV